MSQIDWYYARDNKQVGPVSSAELKRLAAVGEIHPDDLVWREGLTEWTMASNVRGLFEEEGKQPSAEETPVKPVVGLSKAAESEIPTEKPAAPRQRAFHLGDVLLDWLRTTVTARFVDASARVARKCGLYGLLAAMVLAAVYMVIVVVKSTALGNLLSGVTLLVSLVALHYVAGKCCDALDRLNNATAGSLASTAWPNCIAVLSLATGLTTLLSSVSVAVASGGMVAYLAISFGIGMLLVCIFMAFVAVTPATLRIAIAPDEVGAGEEAIGVFAFLTKVMLKAAPVAFGVGVICGAAMMGYACCQALSSEPTAIHAGRVMMWRADEMTADMARSMLVSSASLPLVAYLLFLLYSLLLDLCRAILNRSGKPS